MKYDSQLVELKNLFPTAKNILIALPAGADIDRMAAGLSLFLTLEALGKQVFVVCDDTIKVAQANLFGINHVQKSISQTEGGNMTLVLEGVASSDGTIPALEKLDWYAENNNLNLVFHVLAGQTFQPARIIPHYQGSGFNLIFVIGAVNLNALGNIYQQNQQVFSGTHIVDVDIDTQSANTGFGQTNIVDTNASSVSEVMTNLVADLGYSLDVDSASNLLVGIFDATGNLTDAKVSADTYMAVASCLRVGGRKPQVMGAKPLMQPQAVPSQDLSVLIPKEPQAQQVPEFAMPPVVNAPKTKSVIDAGDHEMSVQLQPSPEERPHEEGVISETPEPDWLTPKIFKGSSIG